MNWITSHWDWNIRYYTKQSFIQRFWSWNSSTSIMPRLRVWQLQNHKLNSWQRQENFLFTTAPRLALGSAQPPTQWAVRLVHWNNEAEHAADHSTLPSNDVKHVLELCLYSSMTPRHSPSLHTGGTLLPGCVSPCCCNSTTLQGTTKCTSAVLQHLLYFSPVCFDPSWSSSGTITTFH